MDEMTGNCRKWLEIAHNGCNQMECLEMSGKSLKSLEWLEMAKHSRKCMEMDVCLEMVGTGWNWLE